MTHPGTAPNRARRATLTLIDQRLDDLKERLRLTHDLGCELVAEIVRLEQEKQRHLLYSERPVLLVKSA